MFSYIWPIALVIISNTVYQVCAKSVPRATSPFSVLTVTYLVSAIVSAIMFFITDTTRDIAGEIGKMNWAPYILGVVIVGLEVGFIYAYKAGWEVSTASIVQSAFLAAALIAVGALFFHEAVTWNKLVGICICLVGLVFINWK